MNWQIDYHLKVPSPFYPCPQKAKGLILALHGYAQMAEDMQAIWQTLAGDCFHLLLLQAPHCFSTPRGKIVSSWMSRFNREEEIKAQIDYFSKVKKLVLNELGEIPLFVVGFSQGGAAAYRACFLSDLTMNAAAIFGCDLPPELKTNTDSLQKEFSLTLFSGINDTIVPHQKMSEDYLFLQSKRNDVTWRSFEGGHEVPLQELETLTEQWVEKSEK